MKAKGRQNDQITQQREKIFQWKPVCVVVELSVSCKHTGSTSYYGTFINELYTFLGCNLLHLTIHQVAHSVNLITSLSINNFYGNL